MKSNMGFARGKQFGEIGVKESMLFHLEIGDKFS